MDDSLSRLFGIQVIYDSSVPKGTVYETKWYVIIGTKETTVTTSRQLSYNIDVMRKFND